LTLLFRIGAGSLLCLMPLALYFLFLATLNQRRRPTMLTGLWDFTCLLLGLSGFLLIGGPVLVGALDSAWRHIMLSGNFEAIKAAWSTSIVIWSTIAGCYLTGLALLIGVSMFRRRNVTVIYNVDPDALPEVLAGVMEQRGCKWRPALGGFEIIRQGNDDAPRRRAFVSIRSFPSLRHASLEWRADHDPVFRQAIEADADKLLQALDSPANPAGGWFMSTAVTIFGIMLIWMIFLIWIMVSHPKAF
jgi:hypothetical protein